MQNITHFLSTLALAVPLAVSGACGETGEGTGTGDTDTGEACVPGQTEACTCEGGAPGAMSCDADGFFGACECAGNSSGGTSDGSGGTSSDSGSGGSDTTAGTSGTGGTTGADDCDPNNPSWSKCIVPIFYDSCGAGISGCHNREAYGADVNSDCRGWMTLEDVPLGSEYYAGDKKGQPTGCPDIPLYDRVVNFAPWQCGADTTIVIPGNAENSYMWRKINGIDLCQAGDKLSDPMPPPESMMEIPEDQKAMIKAWIDAGAPYDE